MNEDEDPGTPWLINNGLVKDDADDPERPDTVQVSYVL